MRVLCLFAILLLAACHHKNNNLPALNTGHLTRQTFKLNTTRDTTIKSANGALLQISAGSFSGTDVELEVREAYLLSDIIKAGLTTTADGRPLSSGGMIYINAPDATVQFLKPITVSLPAKEYDVAMQLYKGEEKQGKINWVEPTALTDTASPYLKAGKTIFEANCATCHNYSKILTGPPVQQLESRGPWQNRQRLIDFTHNPAAFSATDCYVQNLIKEYKQVMPAYPALENADLNAVYDYLKSEDVKRGLGAPGNYAVSACDDSCRKYDSIRYVIEERVDRLQNYRDGLRDTQEVRLTINSNGSPQNPVVQPVTDPPGNLPDVLNDKVTPKQNQAQFYTFDVQVFGWYNIDKLMELTAEDDGRLTVSVFGFLTEEINVFMAVPKYKVFIEGGLLTDGKTYGFYNKDGSLPLPAAEKVLVFAIGEKDQKIFFGYSKFISTANNEISLSLQEVSKEDFDETIKILALPGFSVKAGESKNVAVQRERSRTDAEIQKQSKTLETWRPSQCNCNCGEVSGDSTTTTKPTSPSADIIEIISQQRVP